MKLKVPTKIEIKISPGKGYGVFATDVIEEGEIIEECHLVSLPIQKGESSPILHDYRFCWPSGTSDWEELVVAFGYASMYNHSNQNNAYWRDHPETKAFQFVASRRIMPGEEICVYYGGDEYWADARTEINII